MNRLLAISVFLICVFLLATESLAGNVSKAKEFMKADMYPQAMALLEKEIYGDEKNQATANPSNAEAHFLLGACLVHQGSFSRADERFASAVKLSSDYGYKIGSVYKDAGQELLAKGKLSEADELFKKALGYEPGLKKQIAAVLFETGKRYGNDRLLFMAASYDNGLKAPIAKYYHALSKSAEGDENKVDLLGKAVEYDSAYEGEYHENRQGLGSFHLEKAKEFAKRPGKEQVAEEHKGVARKYLGDHVVEKEIPDHRIYKFGEYTFSLRAGEQTDHWIMFPEGLVFEFSIWSKDYNYDLVYDDGQVVKDGENVVYPKKTRRKFKLVAITDQPEIKMVVKK